MGPEVDGRDLGEAHALALHADLAVEEARRALLSGTVDTNYPVISEGHGVVKALKALGKLPLLQAA